MLSCSIFANGVYVHVIIITTIIIIIIKEIYGAQDRPKAMPNNCFTLRIAATL